MLKPGKYYLGDPCYALSDKRYEEFLSLCLVDNQVLQGEFTFANGKTIVCYNTMYGDGSYHGSNGSLYPVDAGCIALIPIDMAEKDYDSLGSVEEFSTHIEHSTNAGRLQFGHIVIETSDVFDQEDEED